ncbi:MAG: histidine kinase [Bacteroidota bacterium]
MVVNIVFITVKVTVENGERSLEGFISPNSIFYYVSAFFLFMLNWEINDSLLKRYKEHHKLDSRSSLKIVLINLAIILPICALVYYLALFPFRDVIGITCEDPPTQFIIDFSRALVLTCTVIFFNMFYHTIVYQDKLRKQLENLQQEMLASQYASLKHQISPHFLFNSLNTLTSLMYEDRDLASDFVIRLASSYRYILDNREQDLVSLKKELGFLDAFIFMMNVRHREAVRIDLKVKIASERYLIPVLSLQMLVENALKHNRYSKEKPLTITITTIEKDVLVVRNNLQKRELPEETTKLGLKNIKKRYAFYTNQQVLVREEGDFFEVILPLLNEQVTKVGLKVVS